AGIGPGAGGPAGGAVVLRALRAAGGGRRREAAAARRVRDADPARGAGGVRGLRGLRAARRQRRGRRGDHLPRREVASSPLPEGEVRIAQNASFASATSGPELPWCVRTSSARTASLLATGTTS